MSVAPEKFNTAYLARLDTLCDMEVLEARDSDRVMTGRVLIAPGGKHMKLRRSGAQYIVDVRDGPLINHLRPSVGVIMTGMGDDGAQGLLEMHHAGARTAAQDEVSCVVWGMPKVALALGAVDDVVALGDVAAWIRDASVRPVARAA